MRILFQGDSITDAGRAATPDGLGRGHVYIASSLLRATFPERRLEILNRGVSGNRARDLEARWTRDCVELRPDLVSVLVGINDTWRRYDSNDPTSTGDFEAAYRRILERTRDETRARIVVMEPFLLPCPEDRLDWREDLDPRIDAVRRLAREFADVYVPLDGAFAAAAVAVGPEYWAGDGVHPTPAGHALIAAEWLRTVAGLRLAP
jgi:lysophospholipase L1-like esterase